MSAAPAYTTEDRERMRPILELVRDLMADGRERSLRQICTAIGRGSEASISARLREIRNAPGSEWNVGKRRTSTPGLWVYRMTPKPVSGQRELEW